MYQLPPASTKARAVALQLLGPALAAVSPRHLLHACLRLDGHVLQAGDQRYDLDRTTRVVVVGAGKASGGLAQALEEALDKHISGGTAVVPAGIQAATRIIRLQEAGHPIPDSRGAAGAQAALDLATSLDGSGLLICLLSGGASALWPAPALGLSLEDKQRTTALLVRSGATIGEINAVRKHLSRIKGGWLARAAQNACVLTLAISDVVGDDLATIGSGPTVPDPTTFSDAIGVLNSYRLWDSVAAAVRRHLQAGRDGAAAETPKPGAPCFRRAQTVLLGSGANALAAAAAVAQSQGLRVIRHEVPIIGDAVEAGQQLGRRLRELASQGSGVCLLAAGEPTVKVHGPGIGGRTLELALGAARQISGLPQVALLACATDGQDGPSGAAGALVDGHSMRRATRLGLDDGRALADNNTLPFFRALDDVLVTGATGTNVADIFIGVVQE